MKKNKMAYLFLALGVLGFSDLALADSIGTIMNNVSSQNFLSINNFITAGCYLFGVGTGITAIVKFKAHAHDPDRNPLKTPIMLLIVAACAVALPSFIKTGVDTTFGQGAATLNSINGSQVGN